MRHDTHALALLLDYYGPLLTQKQRTHCELCYEQDYSLAEIAEQTGISRQGVHDSLAHAEAALRSFERTLGCAARDSTVREALAQASAALETILAHPDPQVRNAAHTIQQTLQTIALTAE